MDISVHTQNPDDVCSRQKQMTPILIKTKENDGINHCQGVILYCSH